MPGTTFHGTIENGQVRLPANVNLPEQAMVCVVVPDLEDNASDQKFDLAEMLSRMPPDYQVNEERFGEPVGNEEWQMPAYVPEKGDIITLSFDP